MDFISPLKPHPQLSTSRLLSISSPRRIPPVPRLCSLIPSCKRKTLRRLRWRCQADVKGNGSLWNNDSSDPRLHDKVRSFFLSFVLLSLFSRYTCCFCMFYPVLNTNRVWAQTIYWLFSCGHFVKHVLCAFKLNMYSYGLLFYIDAFILSGRCFQKSLSLLNIL